MRVIVFGSREWSSEAVMRPALELLGPGPHVIVHGCCRGADLMAGRLGRKMGHVISTWPADWEKHGKAAGPIRNQEMVDAGADLALGFGVDGRGSQDMLRRLRAAGINISTYAGAVSVGETTPREER